MEQQQIEIFPKTNTTTIIKRKRCPKGTRKHRKTGECVKVNAPMAMEPIPERVMNEPLLVENVGIEVNETVPVEIIKRKRCPKGTRKHRKTGECVKVNALIENLMNEPLLVENVGIEVNEKVPEEKEEEENINVSKSVVLPPSQSTNTDVILDDVLASVPKNSNDYQRKKEKIESDIASQRDEYDFLYPHLDDPNFSLKIARHKEFYDSRYDGEIHDIKQYADKMCNASFELMPHQIFVKNFLSLQTPYNSLLLYHGLGSGKTCSAIGIAEEMRAYMKQIGMKQRIMVVAAPNVQENFKMQLFDERRLREIDGVWNIQSCLGNSMLREINPTSLKGLPKDKIISQIRNIIQHSYLFMGYIELANYIRKKTIIGEQSGYSAEEKKKIEIRNIRRFFDNRLIIIDEVHNIRLNKDNDEGKVSQLLMKVAKYSQNMRLLLLSATPMYNNYDEIIWLVNIMNLNDKRGVIRSAEIFTSKGSFKDERLDANGIVIEEGGESLLQRKMTGYISYVRGENPYTFPYRIYPSIFSPTHTFLENANILENLNKVTQALMGNPVKQFAIPIEQINGRPIEAPLKHTPLYVSEIGEYQEKAYQLVIKKVEADMTNSKINFEDMDKFGFRLLQTPLEVLNMVYPSENLDKQIANGELAEADESIIDEEKERDPRTTMIGKRGLYKTMDFVDDSQKKIPLKHSYSYKPAFLEKYGPIFQEDVLPKYSSKISNIIQAIKKSKGIVMVYSQYIDGGVIPLALALEEMGFARYGSSNNTTSLFTEPRTDPLNAKTMKPRGQMIDKTKFRQAKYTLITGDKAFSPNNAQDIQEVVRPENKDGEFVKVVIISKAGSEGLDFKNIRQIHILDPWYNLNRIEQIIGRAVRNMSHCALPFEERNVEIYMHSTYLNENPKQEAADVYVYRLAQNKAVIIGKVTRLMKEIAVDCIVNIGQTNFTVNKMASLVENQNIEIELSTEQKKIPFKVGDKPFSDICDYMENCAFQCRPNVTTIPERDIIEATYSTQYADSNDERIRERIRNLFRDEKNGQSFYDLKEIVGYVNVTKQYPIIQIYAALTKFVKNKNEYIADKYGRRGNLVNRGAIYAFQPIEINDEDITVFDRKVPVEYKRNSVIMETRNEFTDKSTDSDIVSTKRVTYKMLIEQIVKNVHDATSSHNYSDPEQAMLPVTTSDQNWYRHANRVINHIQVVHGIGFGEIKNHIIRHNVDFLMPDQKMALITHFYAKIIDEDKLTPIEKVIKQYLDTKIIRTTRKTGILMTTQNKWIIYVPSKEDPSKWIEAEPEDIRNFEKSGALEETFQVSAKKYNNIVGFINMFRNEKEMVFRLKDITKMQNNVGTRINGQTPIKGILINDLNTIIGTEMYSLTQSKEIMQLGICVIIEILLRQYNEENKNDKIWFLNPEKAIYNKIAKYRATK